MVYLALFSGSITEVWGDLSELHMSLGHFFQIQIVKIELNKLQFSEEAELVFFLLLRFGVTSGGAKNNEASTLRHDGIALN